MSDTHSDNLVQNNTADNLKILCISDSFGLPRDEVDYNDTWIALLKKKHPQIDFIPLFKRQLTTESLSEANYGEFLKYYSPDIVYLQLGICDCAPRYIKTHSFIYRLLRIIPSFLSYIVWKMIKLRGRRLTCTDVSIHSFQNNLIEYIKESRKDGVRKIIICKIGIPSEKMVASNPNIMQSIVNFNHVIDSIEQQNSDFVITINPLENGNPENYVTDGYHPNQLGHILIGNSIEILLKRLCQI